jgi:nucleoside-diphosphate-sugar epimerase
LAHVYGDYDSKYVGTALSLARVYQHLDKELKWLWTKELRVNTVHVTDAARALWRAAEWYDEGKPGWDAAAWGPVPIFNVVDHGDTCTFTMPLLPFSLLVPLSLH